MKKLLSLILSCSLLSQSFWVLPEVFAQTEPAPAPVQITANTPLSIGASESSSISDQELIQQDSVNNFQGGANFSLPIHTPPGINGFQPSLGLSYNSHASERNGFLGYGWGMDFGSIKRINQEGIDQMYIKPSYYASVGPAQGELVLLNEENGLETYGLRREQSFAKITYDSINNHWTVISTSGVSYKLGSNNDSRLQSPDQSLTHSWKLDKIKNVHGLEINYQYLRRKQMLYPKSIQYGAAVNSYNHPFEIRFQPFYDEAPQGNRQDESFEYHRGFRVDHNYLLTDIEIWVEGNQQLNYALEYRADAFRSDLISFETQTVGSTPSLSQKIEMQYFHQRDGFFGALSYKRYKLRSVSLPKGGSLHWEYLPARHFMDGIHFNEGTQSPLVVVKSLTKKDGRGLNSTTQYEYEHASSYFESALERQLAGFGKVSSTDPLNNKVIQYFHQGGGFDGSSLGEQSDNWYLIGRSYRSERYDPQGNMLQRSITKWNSTPLSPKRSFINQQLATNTTFTNSQSKSTASSYIFDQSNGNLLESIEHGEVTANNDGTFSDIGNDQRKSVISYASNAAKHLLSFPSEQQLYDQNEQLIAQSQTVYDELPFERIRFGNATQTSVFFSEENRSISSSRSFNENGQLLQMTDALGNSSSIVYDNKSLYPQSISNALGHNTLFERNLLYGKTTKITNVNGLITESILDGLGRIIEQKSMDPNQGNQLQTITTTEYQESQFPHAIVATVYGDNQNTAKSYSYLDGFGRIIQTRGEDAGSPGQYIVSNTIYDTLGRTESVSLPVFANGSEFNLNDGSSILTTTTYDALSRPLTVTDANGSTSFSYDLWDSSVTDALGNSKTSKSDTFGRLIEVIEQLTTNNQQFSTKYSYDSRDLLVQIENANGNIRNISYDSLGRLITQEDLHTPADTDFGSRSYTYDDNGNVLSVTKADGTVLSSTYDALNRVLTQSGSTVNYSYSYDQGPFGIGQLSSVTGPDHTWTGSYDIRGRLVSESVSLMNLPQTTDYGPWTKSYTYTRFDQPSTITYPDSTSLSYSYNKVGQIKDINSSAGGIITHIGYSPLSQVEGVSYGNGLRSVFSYDPNQMYRMTKKRTEPAAVPVVFTPLSSGEVSWTSWMSEIVPSAHATLELYYDEDILPVNDSGLELYYDDGIEYGNVFNDTGSGDDVIDMGSFSRGRRVSDPVDNPLRDEAGGEIEKPLVMQSGPMGSGNDAIIYLQTQYRNTMQTVSPAVKYQVWVEREGARLWDSGLVSLGTPLNHGENSPLVAVDTSTLGEGEASWKMFFELEDGINTPMSDMTVFTVAADVTPTAPSVTFLQDIDYLYDAVGNIVSLIENSGTAATKNASYVYDDLYRLESSTVSATTAGQDYTRTQTYGPTGNILSKSDVGAYEYAQQGKTNPQAVSRISNTDGSSMDFVYDDNGNLIQETQTHSDGSSLVKDLSWDELDRIVSIAVTNEAGSVSTVSFVYDQGGRRLSKTLSNDLGLKTTLYPFSDYEVTEEGMTKVSVSANNMHLATIESPQASSLQPPAVFFSHTDHLGGGNILTDSDGEQSQTLDYYPFGSIRVDQQYTEFDETKKYTGHEFDDETGYYYAQARYYHPHIGRFISEDPLGWRVGELMERFQQTPQAFNDYSYTINNPIILVDPNGEFFWFAAAAVLAAVPVITTAALFITTTAIGQIGMVQTVEDTSSYIQTLQGNGSTEDKFIQSTIFVGTNTPFTKPAKGLKQPIKKLTNEVTESIVKTINRGPRSNLRKNLQQIYGKTSDVVQAHHIVAYDDIKADPARKILDKFGIDINDIDNGVFLGAPGSNSTESVIHNSKLHSEDYYNMVNDRLGQANSKEEALETLDGIRNQLLTNSTDWE